MPAESHERGLVIIGGGLAGARAAEGARAAGYTGPLTLAGAEPERPYIRPPLSKDYLAGTGERSALDVHPPEWYVEQRVQLRLGTRATALDLGARSVRLDDGRRLGYERLLLATGATPRPWPGPGAELDGVLLLRTIADSERLRRELAVGGRRIAFVGAGWIGLEVAAAARGYGNDVVVLAPETVPLAAAVGDTVGAVFAELHRANGVELRMRVRPVALLGDESGRVAGVELEGGERVPADLVVVGIGARPATGLAEAAGIEVRNGILCDDGFHTSAPGVLAVGDAANVLHPFLGEHLRTEHWANAEHAGLAAGRSLAGESVRYEEIPYFYTDQYDLGMEYSGFGTLAAGIEPIIRGDLAAREFVAFWVANDRVVAGMNINVWEVNEHVQRLIRSRAVVDARRLADPGVALDRLAAGASGTDA